MNLSVATRWGINILLLLALVIGLHLGQRVFLPLIWAILFTAMLWPAVAWLHRPGLPCAGLQPRGRFPFVWPWAGRLRFNWSLACLVVVTLFVVLVLLVGAGFGLALGKFTIDAGNTDTLAKVYVRFYKKIAQITPVKMNDNSPDFPNPFAHDGQPTPPIDKWAEGAYQEGAQPEWTADGRIKADLDRAKGAAVVLRIKELMTKPEVLQSLALESSNFLWQAALITFVLLFLLIEGPMLNRHLTGIFGPSPPVQAKVGAALNDMGSQIRAYLVWRSVINIGVGLFLAPIYAMLGLSQPVTWALLTAVLLYVPYLGPVLAGVGPTLDAFISCDSGWVAVGLVIFYTVFVLIEGYVIVPVVMGRGMELNATTVMLACLFWEQVWGMSGLFLALPLMGVIRCVCYHVPGWRPWANLMGTGEEPAHEPDRPGSSPDLAFLDETQLIDPRDHDGRAGTPGREPSGQKSEQRS
jgi:predicted PurR-regulated permease PerM